MIVHSIEYSEDDSECLPGIVNLCVGLLSTDSEGFYISFAVNQAVILIKMSHLCL